MYRLGLMDEEIKAFGIGLFFGVVFITATLILFDLAPRQVIKDFENKAVASGHAEWVIETNESGEPEMKFQWKQLK